MAAADEAVSEAGTLSPGGETSGTSRSATLSPPKKQRVHRRVIVDCGTAKVSLWWFPAPPTPSEKKPKTWQLLAYANYFLSALSSAADLLPELYRLCNKLLDTDGWRTMAVEWIFVFTGKWNLVLQDDIARFPQLSTISEDVFATTLTAESEGTLEALQARKAAQQKANIDFRELGTVTVVTMGGGTGRYTLVTGGGVEVCLFPGSLDGTEVCECDVSFMNRLIERSVVPNMWNLVIFSGGFATTARKSSDIFSRGLLLSIKDMRAMFMEIMDKLPKVSDSLPRDLQMDLACCQMACRILDVYEQAYDLPIEQLSCSCSKELAGEDLGWQTEMQRQIGESPLAPSGEAPSASSA